MILSTTIATSEPVISSPYFTPIVTTLKAAFVKLQDKVSCANCSPSPYSCSSEEAQFHYSLTETEDKNICEESDDEKSPQEILDEVFGSDLKNRVEAVDKEEEDDAGEGEEVTEECGNRKEENEIY